MSIFDGLGLLAPDVAEIGAKVALNQSNGQVQGIKRPRKPRNPFSSTSTSLGKGAFAVTTATHEEIQKTLSAELVKYVDGYKTPETKAEALMKIGAIKIDLEKYLPVLRDIEDEGLANEVLEQYFAGGHMELRKAVFNWVAGSEELPLSKAAPSTTGPLAKLATLVDAAPEGAARIALLQKMGVYTTQVASIWDSAEQLQVPDANRQEAIQNWIEDGDGTHAEMKKALAEVEAKRRADTEGVSHKDVVAFSAGNASSHAGQKLGGSDGSDTPDSGIRRSIPKNARGEGSGSRMPGSEAAPGQDSEDDSDPGSGPNDAPEGGGEVKVTAKLRRKGTTGGLGSVAGADGGEPDMPGNDEAREGETDRDGNRQESWAQDGKRRGRAEKGGSLATDLFKMMPEDFQAWVGTLGAKDQQVMVKFMADQGADLIAWASVTKPDTLQKRALGGAVDVWMKEDPEAVDLKKFVAEALATAEEIPLSLATEIMAWEAGKPVTMMMKQAAEAKLTKRAPELKKLAPASPRVLAGKAAPGRLLKTYGTAMGGDATALRTAGSKSTVAKPLVGAPFAVDTKPKTSGGTRAMGGLFGGRVGNTAGQPVSWGR